MSPAPSNLTDGDRRVATALAIVVSIMVIAGATAGFDLLTAVFFMMVWIPGGAILWYLAPVGLTALAAVAVHQAVRSRRVLPRVFAGAAGVFALATFAVPLYAQIVFANAMR